MNRKLLILFPFVFLVVFLGVFFVYGSDFGFLDPKGIVAEKERSLLFIATLLTGIVILPVIFFTLLFASRYKSDNRNSQKESKEVDSRLQILWWLIPASIVAVLSLINWQSTHDLDPFKQLTSNKEPLTIQVVALQWKWLFIYPEQKIASVNFVQFPKDRSIRFQLTADDAPMNSFWIPKLGGQMYAMTGMQTLLNLKASAIGEFPGSAAEINGSGFSQMRFTAKASTETSFLQWVDSIRNKERELTIERYSHLVKPSENNPVEHFTLEENLFDTVLAKYKGHHPTTY